MAFPVRTLIGSVNDISGGRVGLVVQGLDVMAYVCSHDDGFNKLNARWFTGQTDDNGNERVAFGGIRNDDRRGGGSLQLPEGISEGSCACCSA